MLRLLSISLLLAALAAAGGVRADIGFAYADRGGTRLHGRADLPNPAGIAYALCPGNELRPARFVARQKGDPDRDSGRELADNFDFQAGTVFRVEGAKVPENSACLLAPKAYLDKRQRMSLARLYAQADERDACSAELRKRIGMAHQRSVTSCWPVARLGEREGVYAVVFERRGKEALAALVLDADQRLHFMDYPGNAEDESSVWRVDDGGEFDPGAFDILFALRGPQGIEIGVEWLGAEGASLNMLRADGGDRLREVLEDYFYRSP